MSYKAIVGGIIIGGISSFLLVQAQPVMSAFSDPFLSVQLADNPVNGKCLKTDGSENEWGDCGAGGGTGTVTSVDMSVPTGLSISGNPITTSGTLALTLTSGYNIPLTASTTNWNNAYGWGDHASAGYGDVSKVGTPVDNQVAVWTGDGTIEGGTNLTYNGTALRLEKLMQINAPTGNPEFNLQENGTTRSKVYHDVNNNRLTFQNTESNSATAIYFADPATFTGDATVPTEVYGAGWNGSNEVPTNDAVYDKIETIGGGSGGLSTSTDIASTQIIYATGDDTVGATGSFTFDSDKNINLISANNTSDTKAGINFTHSDATGTSTYRFSQDADDLFSIQRTGDTTGDGAYWTLINFLSPTIGSTTADSEATLSLVTRSNATSTRVLDVYNDEYSRDNGMGFRQLYKGVSPNPIRFEFHDKSTNNGAFTLGEIYGTSGEYEFTSIDTEVSGVTPSVDDWVWDNAGTYFADDTKIIGVEEDTPSAGITTFTINRSLTGSPSGATARGKNIKEIMRLTPDRQLLVRKFIASSTDSVAEFGGGVEIGGNATVTATTTTTNLKVTGVFDFLGDVITNVATWFDTQIEALTDVVLQGTWNFSGATVKQHTYKSFTWPATATTTSATTTISLGSAYTAEAWNGADCFVSSSSAPVIFNDGTNDMNGLTATTTVGNTTLSTNNTFTAHETRYVDIGALSDAYLSCTVDITVNN